MDTSTLVASFMFHGPTTADFGKGVEGPTRRALGKRGARARGMEADERTSSDGLPP